MKKLNLTLRKQTIEILENSSHHMGGADTYIVCKPFSEGGESVCYCRVTDSCDSECFCKVSQGGESVCYCRVTDSCESDCYCKISKGGISECYCLATVESDCYCKIYE